MQRCAKYRNVFSSHQQQTKSGASPILDAANEVKQTAANAKQEVQQGIKDIEKKF